MSIASIQSDINTALAIFACFFGLVMGLAMLALRLICRNIRDGYRKDGGAEGMAKKVATKGIALLLKRLIFKKW
jgi:hypothetical protein